MLLNLLFCRLELGTVAFDLGSERRVFVSEQAVLVLQLIDVRFVVQNLKLKLWTLFPQGLKFILDRVKSALEFLDRLFESLNLKTHFQILVLGSLIFLLESRLLQLQRIDLSPLLVQLGFLSGQILLKTLVSADCA